MSSASLKVNGLEVTAEQAKVLVEVTKWDRDRRLGYFAVIGTWILLYLLLR